MVDKRFFSHANRITFSFCLPFIFRKMDTFTKSKRHIKGKRHAVAFLMLIENMLSTLTFPNSFAS